jgi:hypothetical protein
MIESLRYIWQLLILFSLLMLAGILVISYTSILLSLESYIITLVSVTGINLVSFLILARGARKKDQGGVVIMLAGIGAKFILYLLFILAFWLVTKNLDITFILTFFTLYLVLTFFLAISLLKLLKNK